MAKLFNRAKMTTSTTGSGTVTLGSASNGFQTFAAAGVLNGDVVQYVIEEGANFEIGTGTYSSSGTSLTRSPTESSNSNNAITLAGQATVSITAVADDLNRLQHNGSDKVTVSSTGASVTGNLAVSGTVDGRNVASDGSKLDGIESGSTADQTGAEIKALYEAEPNAYTDTKDTKLSGIETGATADQTAAQIRAKVEAASDSNVFTDADHTKLNGIEANAKNDQTITAGGGLTGGGTGDVTISHSDTSSQASVNGSGRTYIQDITLDTYGHVTGLATATETVVNTNTIPNNATITLSAGGALTGGGNFTTDQSSNETITFSHSDTSSQGSVNNSGRTYIQDITLDGYGHVTGINSATETVTNTNTNQLTTFQVEDGDGTEVTISHGKEWKFTEAGGININWTDTSPGSDGDPFDLSFNVSTSINAGGGLTGGGQLNATRTISHADTSSQGSVNYSSGTVIQDVTLDTYGHVTGLGAVNLDGRYYTESESDARFTPIDHFRHTGHGHYTSTTTSALLTEALGDDAFDSKLTAHKTGWSYSGNGNLTDAGRFTELAGTSWLWWTDNSTDNVQGNITALAIAPNTGGSAGKVFIYNNQGSSYAPGWREVWTSTSDGSGSGLDADLLDGNHASAFALASNIGNGTLTVQGTGALGGSGTFTANQSGNTTISISHDDTSSQSSVNNSGRTYIQDITLDGYGHVTGISSATETVVNTDTNTTNFNIQANSGTQVNISAGEEINFINGNATTAAVTNQTNPTVTFHHNDTSSQGSVNNSGGTVIQDVTLDTYGHVTGLTSYNLDGRYYTETEADSRFLNASGDTMTGDLTISGGGNGIKLNNSDIRSAQANPTWTGNPGAVGKIQYHSNRWYIVADQSSNRIVQFRRNDLDKSYIDNNGDLQGGKAAGWITARTLSLTGAITGSVSWDGTGNASLSTSLYNGPNYIDQAIGNYGTVKVDDDRGVNWAGYAIRDDWVFMANGANEAGIYNDTDNEWAIKFIRNAETELYHNGYLKLETSADGIEMSGRIDMNNNDIHGCDQLIHHADTNTYMQFHNADEWRVVCGGTERLEVKNSSPHVYVTGDFAATGNVTAYYSDERLKTKTGNIENALDKVGSLEGFYYVENDLAKSCGFDNEQTQVALSAQQVQAVMPECVSLAPFDIAKNIDGDTGKKSKSGEDYLTIDYAKLVPLLVESIKELKAKVEALENGPSE